MPIPARLAPAVTHLRARAAWILAAGLIGVVASCTRPGPPARTVEGVAAMLGEAVGGEVRPEDFVWEARGGFLSDAFLGRRVLFLAKSTSGTRDLYRARVQLTRAGRPLSVRGLRDLTASPLGDDGQLVAQGHRVGFTTAAFGAVQGISLLDLDGAREAPRGLGERLRAAVARWLATGSAAGVARAEVVFEKPPPEAKIELEGDLLVMALGPRALPAALDTRSLALDTGDKNPFGARAHAIAAPPPPWKELLVERAAAFFGADSARRAERALTKLGDALAPRVAPLSAPSGGSIPAADGWPPDGPAWQGPGAPPDILPVAASGAPPPFAEAAIEDKTTGAAVRLVALDTRRLDLGLAAGAELPRSASGIHGVGRVPAGLEERVVAVFATGPADTSLVPPPAGGLETPGLGVVVDRTLLVPPIPAAPTLAFTQGGAVRVGDWPTNATVLPEWLASLRQTPGGIIGEGVSNSRNGENDRNGERRERSALCVVGAGHLVYAYARGIDAAGLSRALGALACKAILPLATAPASVGFSFVKRRPEVAIDAPDAWRASPVADGALDAPALSRGLRGDFAYVILRDARPNVRLSSGEWQPDPKKQPPPAFLPAIFDATVTELGAQVHVTAFLPGRFLYRLRAGHRELANRLGGAFQTELAEGELGRALAAVGIGNGRRKTPRGFATEGAVGLHFRPDAGVLVVEGEAVRVVKSEGFTPAAHADATELPLTADEGKLRPEAREVGTMRPRAAACAAPDGTLLVAATTFDTDEATTQALLDLGCTLIVALDRGSHHNAFVSRPGGESPPEKRYDASALYVVESPMRGRATAGPF